MTDTIAVPRELLERVAKYLDGYDTGAEIRALLARPASRQTHKGHVLSAFEKRVGMTLGEWVRENAHRYTLDEAAVEIGYSRAEMLRKYAPGAPFRRRPKSHSREVTEAAERAGLPAAAVLSRLRRGWTMGDALSTPVRAYKPKQALA